MRHQTSPRKGSQHPYRSGNWVSNNRTQNLPYQRRFWAFAGVEKFFAPNIGIGARYYYGFSDINEDPELKQRNRALQFSLLLRLNSQQLAGLGF